MSEQGHSDQEMGEGPTDPSTPSQSSEVPADETQEQQEQDHEETDVKSPDVDPNRQGGGYDDQKEEVEQTDDAEAQN